MHEGIGQGVGCIGGAVDERDVLQHGNTALIYSASKGHASVVSDLLAHGADVNATNKVG